MKLILISLCLLFVLGAPETSSGDLGARKTVLENGLVLITSEQSSLPIISFRLLIEAGSLYDLQGKEGLANLTSGMLTQGTSKQTALEIADKVDFIGADLETECRRNLATISLTILKKDLDTGLKLLADLLTESIFPREEVERKKMAVIAAINSKEESPGTVARERLRNALYPQSPYGRRVEGTEKTVTSLRRDDLVNFYRTHYRPDQSILAVVGDISHDQIKRKISHVFRSWKKSSLPIEGPLTPSAGPANFIRVDKDLSQANIVMGHAGVSRTHPDYYAILVMNYILGGGGLSSRLVDSIRNKRGLAYSVYSHFSAQKYMGTFRVSMQTKNSTAQEAIKIATAEIRRIREELVTEEELESAKTFLIGNFPLRFDTNRSIARFLSWVEYLNLGLDYPERFPQLIRQVSREDVRRVARAHLRPEEFIVVMVANLDKVR